jgi:hypothetical protein
MTCKMTRTQLLLVLCTISQGLQVIHLYNKERNNLVKYLQVKEYFPTQNYKLRGLGVVSEIQTLRQNLKLDQLKHKVQKEMDEEKRAKEEEQEERRRIYEKYLLAFQGRSSVLNDFHTNRF